MSTPKRTPRHSRSKSTDSCKYSENLQPNIPILSPSNKPTPSKKLVCKSASKPRNLAALSSPPPLPPRERKFVNVKKKYSTKQVNDLEGKKRQVAAFEKLRASQEEFFMKDIVPVLKVKAEAFNYEQEKEEELTKAENLERKTRSMLMEEAMNSMPEQGNGRVKHIVKAFESLSTSDWPMPNLHPLAKKSNECPSLPDFTLEDELEPRLCSSLDGLDGRFSLTRRTSGGRLGTRRHSLDSSRKSWNTKLKVTSQKPFKLRTEQRGRLKEQKFVKKVTEMFLEEKRLRIPIAQGLPFTIDEPECLIKPPVKESTEPLEIVLHSDVRAVERAEFDQYVMERLELVEHFRLERERIKKIEEEDEIKRLRKELVPKAQPMPYFDRPFIPKKSSKPRTIPKEPRFHIRPLEASCAHIDPRMQ